MNDTAEAIDIEELERLMAEHAKEGMCLKPRGNTAKYGYGGATVTACGECYSCRFPALARRVVADAAKLRLAEAALERIQAQPRVHPLGTASCEIADAALAKLKEVTK